jgi:uncharacterized OB-fold protein
MESRTPEAAPYWEGIDRGELVIPRCRQCGHWFFYPRLHCPSCGSADIAWEVASGRGTLYSYVINRLPAPGWEDRAPYVIAIVELAEGPRMLTNIFDVDPVPEQLPLGLTLRAAFGARDGLGTVGFVPEMETTF